MSSKDKNENEKEKENENENDETLMSSTGENKNVKNKKTSANTKKETNEKKDENNNMLLEYIEDLDDKLFKEHSNGKHFNSFIDEFDRATNEEDKEKVVKQLENIIFFANHDIERDEWDENSECISKLIGIVDAIDYFLNEYSKK